MKIFLEAKSYEKKPKYVYNYKQNKKLTQGSSNNFCKKQLILGKHLDLNWKITCHACKILDAVNSDAVHKNANLLSFSSDYLPTLAP